MTITADRGTAIGRTRIIIARVAVIALFEALFTRLGHIITQHLITAVGHLATRCTSIAGSGVPIVAALAHLDGAIPTTRLPVENDNLLAAARQQGQTDKTP